MVAPRSRLWVAMILVAVLLAAANWRHLALKEDVSVMVPGSLAPAISLFQRSPLAKKVFIVVKGTTPELTREAADALMAALPNAVPLVSPAITPATLLALHERYTPGLWDDGYARQVEPLLREENVVSAMRENLRMLSGPEGIFLKPWITADPLHIMPFFGARLKTLAAGANLDSSSGYLASPDGSRILLVFDSSGNPFENDLAREVNASLEKIRLPQGTSAFLMGSARYTAENRQVIESDLSRVFLLSCTLLSALFLWFFRERHALLIYLIPPVTVLIAATGTNLIFGGLSGITLGFSAVLLGMASDYSTYVYFALRASTEAERWSTVRKVAPTITLSALTLVLAFSLLGFAQIALFKQLAVFVVIGLAVEWAVAIHVAPTLFPCRALPQPAFTARDLLGPRTATWLTILLLAAGAASLPFVNFNFRLEALNTVSAHFERDKQEFEALTGNLEAAKQFLFVLGKTKDEALENNEKLSLATPGGFPLGSLFVPSKTAAANLRNWREFWSPERIGQLRSLVEREASATGLKPSAFAPFFDFLAGDGTSGGPDLETLYNPFIEMPGGGAAVFNIIPEGKTLPRLKDVSTLSLSQAGVHKALYHHVTHRIALILAILLAGGTLLLRLALKNTLHALLCLLPGMCGIALFLIVLAISRVECNLFGFFILPMLIGLGINYGIFIVQQQTANAITHPTRAVIATSLSTLAGFGALVAAHHKVLFILGLGAFTGVLGAIACSVLLLPPLLKIRPSASALVRRSVTATLLLLLAGCTAFPIRYTHAPAPRATGTAVEHAGVYRNRLPFRALAVKGNGTCRAVILSDVGIKLVDLAVTPSGAEIYFKSKAVPKIVATDFARFYAAWAFEQTTLSRDGKTVRYCPGGHELLWITTP